MSLLLLLRNHQGAAAPAPVVPNPGPIGAPPRPQRQNQLHRTVGWLDIDIALTGQTKLSFSVEADDDDILDLP